MSDEADEEVSDDEIESKERTRFVRRPVGGRTKLPCMDRSVRSMRLPACSLKRHSSRTNTDEDEQLDADRTTRTHESAADDVVVSASISDDDDTASAVVAAAAPPPRDS